MHNSFIVIILTWYSISVFSQNNFSLEEAIQYGIENHRTLKAKQIDVSLAESDIKDYRSIGMPKLNGKVDYSYYAKVPVQATPDFLTPAVYGVLFAEDVIPQRNLGEPNVFEIAFVQPHNLTGALEASILAFDGSYLVGLKAAKLYRELVKKELTATEQQVRGNITKAYMSVLISQENLVIVTNNIKTIAKTLEETKIVFEEGFAESLDVDRLTLSYNNLNTEKEKLEGLIELSKNLLKFQMNFPIDQDISLSQNLESMVIEALDLAIDENIEYSRRGEFEVLETTRRLHELDVQRYRRGYLPSLRLFANASQSLQRQNLFDGDEAGWLPAFIVGAGINLPIYDGGEKGAKIQKAKLNIEKTNLMIEDFKQSVDITAYNALISLENAQKTVNNTRNALKINERIYEKTQIKFREGVGSSLEVTQAEGGLYQAQGAYINALYDLITAKTDLEIALGKI